MQPQLHNAMAALAAVWGYGAYGWLHADAVLLRVTPGEDMGEVRSAYACRGLDWVKVNGPIILQHWWLQEAQVTQPPACRAESCQAGACPKRMQDAGASRNAVEVHIRQGAPGVSSTATRPCLFWPTAGGGRETDAT